MKTGYDKTRKEKRMNKILRSRHKHGKKVENERIKTNHCYYGSNEKSCEELTTQERRGRCKMMVNN